MFADLNPTAEVPSRRTLSRLVETSATEMMVKITNRLNSLPYICTTADIWSTKHRSFMGVTAHWVTICHQIYFVLFILNILEVEFLFNLILLCSHSSVI